MCGSHLCLAALSQVVGEVVVDIRAEATAILWVEAQDLPQGTDTDVLQVTVGQSLHVGIGLNHLLLGQRITADQVPFPWGMEENTHTSHHVTCSLCF